MFLKLWGGGGGEKWGKKLVLGRRWWRGGGDLGLNQSNALANVSVGRK